MKIIQINVTANSGSTGRIAEGIGLSVQNAGHESLIAWGRYANRSRSELIRIGCKPDHWEHAVESRIFDNHGLASRRATATFLKTLDGIRPDIVHLHNIHGYYLNCPMLFRYLAERKIPVVWTLHDCWSFTGHCVYFDFCGCDRWKTACHHCPQKKTYPASLLFDRSRKNYEEKKHFFTLPEKMILVPVSRWLSDLVASSFLKNYPRRIIYNGIDTDVFHPCDQAEMKAKFGFEKEKIVLGVASVWSPRKGLKDFIELAARLPQGYRIVLVGLTEKQKHGLPVNITGISRTESAAELAQLYSAADVFVNPTWGDNYPTTNLEAISCGTPVITYRTGGSPESVPDNNGAVVAKGDIARLTEAILSMKKDPDSCRRYALDHFRMQDRFNDYIELYRRLFDE